MNKHNCDTFRWISLPALLTFLFTLSVDTHAAVIFSDDFTRSNADLVGNTWQENEAQADDVSISSSRLRLRDTPSSNLPTSALISVDLSLWEDIEVEFSWQVLSSTEHSDYLYFGLENPANTPLFQTSLGERGVFNTRFGISQNDLSATEIALGFWTQVNASTEQVYIHDFSIHGNLIEQSPESAESVSVNEPMSASLLAIGLIALSRLRKV